MARTTLLPTPPLNAGNLNDSFKTSQKSLSQTQTSVKNISDLLVKKTKVRKEIFSSILEDRKKRDLESRRREREDEIEAKKTVSFGGIGSIVQSASAAGGSFLDRIIKALGFIAAGWILRRLPTWIGYAKEFIARVEELGRIIRSFVGNVTNFFSSLFNTLGELKNNLLRFDLFDSQRNVRDSFDELTKSIEGMGNDFQDTIDVFTTDLTKQIDGVRVGSYSEEPIPEQGEGFTPPTSDSSGSYGAAPSGLFELIAGGEGGYESINRGDADDSPGGAKKYLGKNLQDMTLSEIMSLQSRGAVSAVGKYQIVTGTMPGFVRWLQSKGYDPKTTKYTSKIQDLYPQYTIESKRPQVGKFLSGSMNDIQKANLELAAEFASVGVPFDMKAGSYGGGWPKRDIKKGESLYSGKGRNRASITPEQVQKALAEAKKSGGNLSPTKSTSTPSSPAIGKIPSISVGERAGYSPSRGREHRGRDIAAPPGTGLTVPSDSVITDKGVETNYGNYVVFKDSKGIEHFYGHMIEQSPFNKGDTVKRGQIIGRVGSTGRSTGSHLHWEISPRPGEVGFSRKTIIDPIEYGYSSQIPFTSKVSSEELRSQKPSPQQISPQAQTQAAQISPAAPTQQRQQAVAQQITPERKAQDIVAVVPTQQQPQQNAAAPQQTQQKPTPSVGDMLNNFIKQKFLLDLSYL